MSADPIEFEFEGRKLGAQPGDTVAAALLRDGVRVFSRGPKYHRPRGPFCFTGHCSQCHMRIGGEPNLPACLTPVTGHLRVERQNVIGSGDTDLLRAVDFLYPEGIDHHHLMTQFKVLNVATKAIARRLAGIGELPSHVRLGQPARTSRHSLVVIGAGPAGLSAALAAVRAGLTPLVLEGRTEIGGHVADGFSTDPEVTPQVLESWRREIATRGEVAVATEVVGLYDEGGEHLVVARTASGLWQIAADRVVLATGTHDRPLPFEGNDLPGVFAGRGLLGLIRRHGVRPGKRVLVVGSHRDASAVARSLLDLEVDVVGVVDPGDRLEDDQRFKRFAGARPLAAVGRSQVRGLRLALDDREETVKCDAIAVVSSPVPSYELAAEVGARARYDGVVGGFALNEGPVPGAEWLHVAGSVTGTQVPAESGRRVGQTLGAK